MQERERRIYEELKRLGITYELYQHNAVMTIADAAEIDKKIGISICKNLFLSSRHGTEFYLLSMPGHKKFDTGKVSKQLHLPRMTFASQEAMLSNLDILPGSVSPLGLMNDKEKKVRFLIEETLLEQEKIAVHPCVNTATLVLNLKELIEILLPSWGYTVTVVKW